MADEGPGPGDVSIDFGDNPADSLLGTPETPAAPESVSTTPASPTAPPTLDPYDFRPPGEEESATPAAPVDSTATGAVPASPAPDAISSTAQFSQIQFQRAANLGLTPDQLGAYKTPEALELALTMGENIALKSYLAAQQQAAQQQRIASQPAPAAPKAPPQKPADFNEQAFRDQLKAQGFDEPLIELHTNFAKQQHGVAIQSYELALAQHKNDEWQQQMYQWAQGTAQQVQQQQQAHQAELINRDFADFISKQPEHAQKLLADPQVKAQVFNHADWLFKGMVNSGVNPPANAEIFKLATNAALGDKLLGVAREQVRQQVQTHQNRAVSRPTPAGAGGTTKRGYDAAAEFADQFWRAARG